MEDGRTIRKRGSCWGRCCAAGCLTPVFLFLLAWAVFSVRNKPPSLVIPTPVMPKDNGYDDFVRAGKLAKAMRHKSPASMVNRPTTAAGILAATKACTEDAGPMLAALRKGFGKECMEPPVRSANAVMFPGFAELREAEREIMGVAQYYDLTNRPWMAADVRIDGEELAVMMPRGGSLIAALVAVACQAISMRGFEANLPKLSRVELARVCSRLERIQTKWTPTSEILREEGRSNTAMLLESFRDPKTQGLKAEFEMARTLMNPGSNQPPTAKEIWEGLSFAFRDKNAILEENLRYFEAVADEARGPYSVRTAVPTPNNFLTQMMAPLVDQERATWTAAQSVLQVYRVESAVYLYKADKGRFPKGLDELRAGYLKGAPTDPCGTTAGALLHYKALYGGKAFLLYSVGPDGVDNGGVAAKHATQPGGDVVAGRIR